jgi:hypothetical protein
MTTTVGPGSVREWVLKRGVLYILTQTPLIALFLGYFYRVIDFPTANAFTVVIAFALLPIWVLVRKHRSTDPEEPVHHLHKYALWALVPYVVYNIARVPMHYLLDIVFWDHWYDFGSELTGKPVDQWSSLVPGTLLHSLQGYVLALGFYILFKRHSLRNALIYVFIFLSVIYTWTFPTFVLVDFQPPAKWFFVVWWAHFWMAIAAWYVPKSLYSRKFWDRFSGRPSKAVLVSIIMGIYLFPVSFVFWRVATWQFPYQHAIDQKAFQQMKVVLQNDPVLTSVHTEGESAGEAHYQFSVRLGPRPYKDYIKATKALDAGPVLVTGRLMREGEIIAICREQVDMLETPNNILVPAKYIPALRRMEYTDVTVECAGPATLAGTSEAPMEVAWTAHVTLIGDREQEQRSYRGAALTSGGG